MGHHTENKLCVKKCILTQRVNMVHEKLVTPNPCMRCTVRSRQKNEAGADNKQSRKDPVAKFEPKEPIKILKRQASTSSKHSSECTEPSGSSNSNANSRGVDAQESTLSELVRNSDALPPGHPETMIVKDSKPPRGWPGGWPLGPSSEKKSQGPPILPKIITDFPAVLVSEVKPEPEPMPAPEYFSSVASQPQNAPPIDRQAYKSIADFAAQRKLANACVGKAESVHMLGVNLVEKLSYYEGMYATLDEELVRIDEKLARLKSIHLKLVEKSWNNELEEELENFAALERAEKESKAALRADGWAQDIAYVESKTVGYINGAMETVPKEFWKGFEDVCADDPSVAWLDFRRDLTITERTYFQNT
jgi:hypothetical protein